MQCQEITILPQISTDVVRFQTIMRFLFDTEGYVSNLVIHKNIGHHLNDSS